MMAAREDDKNPLSAILGYTTPGMETFINRRNTPGYNEVWPRVFTSDLRYRRLLIDMLTRMHEALPVSRNDKGELEIPGIPTDFSEFRTVQAVLPSPAGTPPFDSSDYVRETLRSADPSELTNDEMRRRRAEYAETLQLPPDVKRIITNFTRAMFRNHVVSAFPIKRTSSMGLPHMTSDLVTKAKVINDWKKNARMYASMLRAGDLRSLAAQEVVLCYFNGYRAQLEGAKIVDGIAKTSKDRMAMDWKGEWVHMDRTLPERHADGSEDAQLASQLLCARSRAISASPMKATLLLRIIARAYEAGLGVRYAYTFKHREKEDILAKVGKSTAYSVSDVKSHDQMLDPHWIDAFCDVVRSDFGDAAGTLASLMFHAPMLVRNDYRGGKGAVQRGNPLRLDDFVARYSNPSGIPPTSNVAKEGGGGYIYLAACLAFPDVYTGTEENAALFLAGRTPIGLLNLGDNNLTHTSQPEYADFCRRPWAWMPYAVLEPTDTFAGYVVVRDPRGHIDLLRNITTYVKNIVSPDRTMGHPLKGNWAVSLPLKKELYGDHPAFQAIDEILQQVVVEHLGVTLEELAAATPVPPPPVRGLNLVEADFLNNPESIEYKYEPSDIRQELLDLYYVTGTAADAEMILEASK